MSAAVGVVGAGSFGTALAILLARDGREVVIWSRTREVVDEINGKRTNEQRLPGAELPAPIAATADAAELAERARLLVLAVAPADVLDRARRLGEVTTGRHIIVHATGALTDSDDRRVSEVLAVETPVKRLGAIAGPVLPGDLLREAFASMVVASEFDEVADQTCALLGVPRRLRIYQGRDLVGVELGSALASAYTVALGMADSLGLGPGPRATLITRTVAEGGRIIEAAGGEARTMAGLAGLGNLLVKCQPDAESLPPSYRYGRALGRGEEVDAEHNVGARAALALLRLADRLGERAPVLRSAVAVIRGERSPMEAAAMAADTVARQE